MLKSKPNIVIIDEAIRRVQEGWDRYSCVALSNACERFGGFYWGSEDSSKDGTTYRDQYRLVMTNSKKKLPKWWDSEGDHKYARIRALRKFKAACIKAGAANV